MAELSGLALCTEFTFIQQEGCMVTLKEDYSESVIFTMTFFYKNISTSYTNTPSNSFKTAFQFTHQRESKHKPDNEKVFVKAAPARIYPPKSSHKG